MPETIRVGPKADIPDGECTVVTHGRARIAVFNAGGRFFAINDACPHAGGPLSEGFVDGMEVTCPWHGWTFGLDPENCDDDGCMRYTVREEDGDLVVEVS